MEYQAAEETKEDLAPKEIEDLVEHVVNGELQVLKEHLA